MIEKTFPKTFPTNTKKEQPGVEKNMNPRPIFQHEEYDVKGDRLKNKVAIIKGDIGDETFCNNAVKTVMDKYNKIDIFVSNAGEQHPINNLGELTYAQIDRTFRTNIYGALFMCKALEQHLKDGANIILTTSITAYNGHERLIDYSATKGALTSLTRSLALMFAPKGIRVNAVAPGPIWTPLIPSTFTAEELSKFGSKTALKRAGQPVELAEAYVFLASQGASFITGETIHVNGGEIVNS